MPLTHYGARAHLRPYAVTMKGQRVAAETTVAGNPCEEQRRLGADRAAAALFPGQGAQTAGMLPRLADVDGANTMKLTRAARRMVRTAHKGAC